MTRRFSPLLLLLLLLAAPGWAQVPTRLVQAGELEPRGSFALANAPVTCGSQRYDTEYVNGTLAVSGDVLYLAGHGACSQGVAAWRVPASLSGTAAVVQAAADVTGGRLAQINPSDPNQKSIGGLLVLGDRLVASAYSGYDGAGSAVASHFVRSAALGSGSTTGPYRVGDRNPAFYAGYMATIPAAWRSAFGGDVLTGQCCLSIISRTSFGPSVSVVSSADLVAARTPTPATMLVGYPSDHKGLGEGQSAGAWTLADRVTGVAVLEGSVLFIGRHGTGPYCYGSGAACSDPEDGSQGTHAYPYAPWVWAYRAADLAAVTAGQRQPWDVTPYAGFRLPSAIRSSRIGGAAYDAATGRLYVSEIYGDGAKPRIHVLTLRGAGAPVPDPPPDPTPDPTPEPEPVPEPVPDPPAPAPSGWVLTWADEFEGTALDPAVWNIENSTTNSYGGNLQAWRPANVTLANGVLRLTGRRESSGGRQYTSGAVNTRLKQTFGPEFRLEVRANIPAFRGGWPAIWTREGLMPNPDRGVEIDVMENIGDPNVVYQVQHTWNLNGSSHQQILSCAPYRQSFAGQMHVYAVEVVGGQTRWSIDGQPSCGPSNVTPQQASHLLLNLSIGGSWPGPPDGAATGPWHFDIDYVRVYTRGTAPAPRPVDAVVSPWGDWQSMGAWSICVPADSGAGGVQTRSERRTRTVVTPARDGGSTPPLSETRVATRNCALPPPDPEPEPEPEPEPPAGAVIYTGTVQTVEAVITRECSGSWWRRRCVDVPTGEWSVVLIVDSIGTVTFTRPSDPGYRSGAVVTVKVGQ